MLDVVMVASRPNYPLMAARRVEAKGKTIRGSLPSTVDLIGTPGKIVLSLEGGTHQDFEAAEAYLQSQVMAYQICFTEDTTSYYEALMRGLAMCRSSMVAIVPPWIEVKDKQWVQRMIWPLGKDSTALLCGTFSEQGVARTLAPVIMKPRTWPGGDFFVARREKLLENLRLCNQTDTDFTQQLATASASNGWRLWAHPGVRFENHKHELHERKTPRKETGSTTSRPSRRQQTPLL